MNFTDISTHWTLTGAEGNIVPDANASLSFLDRFLSFQYEENPFLAENRWRNEIILPEMVREFLPHTMQTHLRNFLAGTVLYQVVGLLWCLVIYGCGRHRFFGNRGIPSIEDMWKQMWASQKALVFYTLMPTLSEWAVENGYTFSYYSIGQYGWPMYLLFHFIYLAFVEFCIYWIHRGMFLCCCPSPLSCLTHTLSLPLPFCSNLASLACRAP